MNEEGYSTDEDPTIILCGCGGIVCPVCRRCENDGSDARCENCA